MTELQPVEEDTERRSTYESERDSNEGVSIGSYRAALKLTSPLLPIMAVVMTALAYLLADELLGRSIELFGSSINEGVLASFVGLVLAFAIWLAVSFPARSRATARESNPPTFIK
jgi:hypothetical protein